MISDTKTIFLHVLEQLSTSGFSVGIGFTNNEPAYAHSTYKGDWIDYYVQSGFLREDPTIIHGQKHAGHFLWSDLNRMYPGNPVFSAAKRFDLEQGNTLSMRINGDVAIVSCAGHAWTDQEQTSARAALAGLYEMVMPPKHQFGLTEKVLDVVRLMTQGLRDIQIAEELGIKLETVRARRAKAQQITGAKSPAQLVSVVIKSGSI